MNVSIDLSSLYKENAQHDVCGATFEGTVLIQDEHGITFKYPFSFIGKVGTPESKGNWFDRLFSRSQPKITGSYLRKLKEQNDSN